MSILVHPDKNPDDRDRAQEAFESKCTQAFKKDFFLSRLSRLNVVQKETMWSLILYVVCM